LKKIRHKKVLGLALGERSLLVAEVIGDERPTVSRTAEMVYPEGITPARLAELGPALSLFLSQHEFSARTIVIGLPARWLVTQPKEVPAADERTKVEMLRLSAEAEFSTELKDLVYDFTGSGTSVLLVATPKRYVDAAAAICEAARLNLITVTATALALGEATGRGAAKDVLVLSVAGGGGEMTLQRDSSSGALRHLRPPQPEAPFINELRRTVSTMPSSGPSSSAGRELILWDGAGLNVASLSEQIGTPVRNGDLSLLGVFGNGTGGNGQYGAGQNGPGQNSPGQAKSNGGGQYAAAIALALEGIGDLPAPVDFLHSRLAPPRTHRIPRWAILAAAACLLFIVGTVWAYHDLHVREDEFSARQAVYDKSTGQIDDAKAFVDKVTFAQAWYGGDPRYLACMRDMTLAMSEDYDTFAISLIISEPPHNQNSKTPDTHALTGVLQGKAADQQRVLLLLNRLRNYRAFVEVTPGGSDTSGRVREVTFSINFKYQLPKSAH
jgi:hypothetical protein